MSGGNSSTVGEFATTNDVVTQMFTEANDSASNSSYFCEPLLLFESIPYKAVAVVSSLVGLFSLICSSVVVLMILCTKKYRVFHQQFTLHLAVAVTAHSLVYTIDLVDLAGQRELTTHYCRFIGFIELYTSWVELLSIASITLNLILLSVYEKEVDKLHAFHILVVYLLPLFWCWIPFAAGAYGVRGPWCGIRVHNITCDVFLTGILMRFALWQIPLYVFFFPFFVISSVVVFVTFKKRVEHWEGPCHQPEAKKGRHKIFREIKPLLLFPLIYLLLKLPLLISQLYEAVRPLEPQIMLWILEAIFCPFAGAMVAVMYGLDPQTRSKLRRCQLKSLCLSCCEVCIRKQQHTPKVAAYNVGHHEMYGDSVEGEAARIKANYLKRLSQSKSLSKPSPLTLE